MFQEEYTDAKAPVGIDLSSGEALVPSDTGIWDNYRVKRQLLHSWSVSSYHYFMKLKQLYFYKHFTWFSGNINLLLAVHEGCTGKYWPKVVAVHNQYSPVQLKQPRLVSSYKMAHKFWICRLSKTTNTQPVNFFMETVCIAKSLQEKKKIRTLRSTSRLPCHVIKHTFYSVSFHFKKATAM